MKHLLRKESEQIDIQDLLHIKDGGNTLQEFELVSNNQVITLPKNLFILISPLLKNMFKTISPCLKPVVVIPNVSAETLDILKEVVDNVVDENYATVLNTGILKSLENIFRLLQVDMNYFKIGVASPIINNLKTEPLDVNVLHVEDEMIKLRKENIESISIYSIKTEAEAEEEESVEGMIELSKENIETTSSSLIDAEAQEEEFEIELDDEALLYEAVDKNDIINLECHICSQKYQYKDRDLHLQSHSQVLNKIIPNKDDANGGIRDGLFKCQYCSEKFMKKQLIAHLSEHIAILPKNEVMIFCPEKGCKKTFGTNQYSTKNTQKDIPLRNMEVHLRKHNQKILKVMPFQCNYCSRSFVQKGDLVTHYKRKHKTVLMKAK